MIKQTIKAAMVDTIIKWFIRLVVAQGATIGTLWVINIVFKVSTGYLLPMTVVGIVMILLLVRKLYSAYMMAKSWGKMKDLFSNMIKDT